MTCQHDIGGSVLLVLCDVFDRMVPVARCGSCLHFVEGVAAPRPYPDPQHDTRSPAVCEHRGQILTDEPCSCGSISRVSVYACYSPARVRSFQDHAYCVPLSVNWDRLADPMARTSFPCCETCEHRTTSLPAEKV